MHPQTDITKESIRDHAKMVREGIPAPLQAEWSGAIHRRLLTLMDGYDPVMVYVSKPPEVRTHEFIRGLLAAGRRVIVPIIEREDRSLRLSYLDDLSSLVPSTFNVPEPIGSEVPAPADEVGLTIIPVIAFDGRGNRLGYGAGYYDRFLASRPGMVKVGLAFSCQEAASIPADDYDIKLDCVVTERGIIRF